MRARFMLLAALALVGVGMAVVVLATVHPGLFYVGVYLLDAGFLALAGAAAWHVLSPPEPV